MDDRVNNGGARKGAGRKPKADEQQLVEKLTPLDEVGFKALKNGLTDGQSWAVKLFMEYRFGKPKQQIENTNINYNEELTTEEASIIKKELLKKY